MSGDGTRDEPLIGPATGGATDDDSGRAPGTRAETVAGAGNQAGEAAAGATDGTGADGCAASVPRPEQVPPQSGARTTPAGAGTPSAREGQDDERGPQTPGAETSARTAPAEGSEGTVLPGPWSVPSQRSGRGVPAGLTVSDAELIRGMRSGDDRAYEELFRRHSGAVRRYARSCCRDAHTAEDLTAEVFARTLQAVRGGKGPEEAVRAYLMTAVRHVAAVWTKSARREHLVDDFAVFADRATRTSELSEDDTLDPGADVRAMHEAEQSMALRAFRSLPERWQAVLWHTTVEKESPSEVAPLFGLSANATAVLAGRAREGLKQAYLQEHVSQALVAGGDCARYADRLGAYARGGLRTRAERGLRKHLEGCAQCRVAAGELQQVNAGIPALLPVAVIGWFATAYSLEAAGVVAGSTLGVAGAGAAAATGTGAATGTTAASGATAGGTATGGAGGGSAAGGAVAEGLGAPVKVGVAAAVAIAAAAGLVWALAGDEGAAPVARPPVAATTVPSAAPVPVPPAPTPAPVPPQVPTPGPSPTAAPKPPPSPPVPTPSAAPAPRTPDLPTPAPARPVAVPPAEEPPAPAPLPTSTGEPAPEIPAREVHLFSELGYDLLGDGTVPAVRLHRSSPIWQRHHLSIASVPYAHGVTVGGSSSVVIRLDGRCTRYEAMAGIDDLALGLGAVRFSVHAGEGGVLWRSGIVRGGSPAVPVSVALEGRTTVRLVVEPVRPFGGATMGDWADSRFTCA
ncbi:sigma-70 family RNA polymerase sigma factor [Streptomyces sp. AM 2-1-1]|uniref:sigma-70 family RNA polymerase sigma factor n=1 Tax=Streptomyces sp. AM 2-1-1 TaxID=3028709 RepID=UPI0023B8F2DD|nr:sigma-70 family RNA polymerase sigma factor [Streptomyces sp. AM 2-1-1]WEH41012.1 sigma-70 family RNA polymerase sigma factor [Streptomyces sp. AM 2-1-1]